MQPGLPFIDDTAPTRAAQATVFSPSDLNHFLECEYLIQIERAGYARDPDASRDAHSELLAAKGAEHEQAWLERFRSEGRRVVTVEAAGADWEQRAAATIAALRAGADVVYQGAFVEGNWRGVSDFLVRVERPSTLGGWSYEAWDTKLARHTRPYFVLQLCFYSAQLERIQGVAPEVMVVVLGTGTCERLNHAAFDAYFRSVKRRFVEAASADRVEYPYPVQHCTLCEHERSCERRWAVDDHLSLVAGIRREQVERLNEAGIRTVRELATAALPNVGIGTSALERLRHQARLQAEQRRTGVHRYELLPLNERTGFRLLPAPSPGDIFFDIEGDPYFTPAHSLDYLFGVMTVDESVPRFRSFQAFDRGAEKRAFEQFIDFVRARLDRWPSLHVYHYAAYEQTAVKRLMSEHATREDEVDALLRREVFVDLYQVVRQSIRISHDSYSIKKVRTFFMPPSSATAVADGADSILQFERWRRTGEASLLQAIVDYNQEDCVSTVKLRDWLIARKREAERASGTTVAWKVPGDATVTPERLEEDEAIRLRRERLHAQGDAASAMLANLLNYHRREAKPEWWSFFDRQKKSLDDLIVDTEAIAQLEPVGGIEAVRDKKSLVHTLAFPPQEFKLGPGDAVEDPFTRDRAGHIAWLDAGRGRLGLKRGPRFDDSPLPSAIVASRPLDNSAQRSALCRVADDILHGRTSFGAGVSLLARDVPRLRQRAGGMRIQTLDTSEQEALVDAMDESHLFIQGPPGSGKTWTGARLIVSMIAKGHRVGVAATSHKAIHNLLTEVERVAADRRVRFTGLKKSTAGDDDSQYPGDCITNSDDAGVCETSNAQLVAGTSWLFAREGMHQQLDYLFIDEAGQVSLADAVAMSTSARNVVLLGDPQQLPHVTQGIHPDGSGCSVLEHLLGDRHTVADDRGLFLARSWRMHPEICRFISELAYAGRLESAAGCERQRIDSPGQRGTGLRYLAVEHQGNAQQSPEEARVIADEVRHLLSGGRFVDRDGASWPLAAKDILVVAPYNMQVRCLREVLPDGVDVGTVDKFQGREAPVVFFSMASSSGDDVPRGLEFLFNRNRFNVAVSRARCLAVVASSPRLLDARCRTVEQMRLVNAPCRFAETAAQSHPDFLNPT